VLGSGCLEGKALSAACVQARSDQAWSERQLWAKGLLVLVGMLGGMLGGCAGLPVEGNLVQVPCGCAGHRMLCGCVGSSHRCGVSGPRSMYRHLQRHCKCWIACKWPLRTPQLWLLT